MSLARIRYLQSRLAEKYGEVGVVAGRYLEAGFHVRLMHPTRLGPVHIFAQRGSDRLVIEVVKDPGKVSPAILERVAKKAELLRSKPILVLYSDGPKLDDEARAKAEELGVKVRRIRVTKPRIAVS